MDVARALFLLAGLEGAVEQFAVVVHHSGNIERRFFAALDFERGHAGAGEVVRGGFAGQVLHGKNEAAGGVRLASGGGLRPEAFAAGVGARAAVSRTPAQ